MNIGSRLELFREDYLIDAARRFVFNGKAGELAGRPVTVEIAMSDADLYSVDLCDTESVCSALCRSSILSDTLMTIAPIISG